ncbi:unnamed protein product [Meganyctiphanes norvegica]|uniref:Uncharacterized protein n=1 Tax=Meganyctiphanes norvegica TaxID=48144 RepID=A0AAV2SLJ9_MEGNR
MEDKPVIVDKTTLGKLLNDIDTVLLDCDGVLWAGARGMDVINRSNEAVQKLKSLGKNVFFVTNNSTRSQENYMEKCRILNFDIEKKNILCAPFILAHYLKKIGFKKKIYVVGAAGLAEEINKVGVDCIGLGPDSLPEEMYKSVADGSIGLDPEVGGVVVGFDRDFNYAKIVKATCYLTNPECIFLATNTDKVYPVLGTPYHLPAAGVVLNTLECSSGRKAQVMGKPALNMFNYLVDEYQIDPKRTLMVGDTIYTDILFGNMCNMQTLLVLSGVSNLKDIEESLRIDPKNVNQIPNYYLNSFGDILNLLD